MGRHAHDPRRRSIPRDGARRSLDVPQDKEARQTESGKAASSATRPGERAMKFRANAQIRSVAIQPDRFNMGRHFLLDAHVAWNDRDCSARRCKNRPLGLREAVMKYTVDDIQKHYQSEAAKHSDKGTSTIQD